MGIGVVGQQVVYRGVLAAGKTFFFSAQNFSGLGFTFAGVTIISGRTAGAPPKLSPLFSRSVAMDQESLKMLIEALSTMGSDAKEALIWYIVMSRLPTLLWAFSGPVLIFVAVRGVYQIGVQAIRADKSSQVRARLLVADAIGSPAWFHLPSECKKVADCLREHYKSSE